ncbi:MAG: hypothetical protein A4E35_00605 [Methanoregula sp. PtaU1.Bin051]|nr:MAG: hypothetical protein A4E35_00605 [Methanoregula sp. PtaU1.Bin051]
MLKLAAQKIILDRIKIKGRVHRLAKGLEITVESGDDQLILSNDRFGLTVSAPTLEEGIAGISEEIDALFEVYVDEKIENLTHDAIRLRSSLRALIPAGAGT